MKKWIVTFLTLICCLVLVSCSNKLQNNIKQSDDVEYTEQHFDNISIKIPSSWRESSVANGLEYSEENNNAVISVSTLDLDLSYGLDTVFSSLEQYYTDINGYFDSKYEIIDFNGMKGLKISCYVDNSGKKYIFTTHKLYIESYIIPSGVNKCAGIVFSWLNKKNPYRSVFDESFSSLNIDMGNLTEADITSSYIKSIKMNKSEDITLEVGDTYSDYVNVDVSNKNRFTSEDIEFITDDPQIATISFLKDSWNTSLYYEITAVGAGETTVYARSFDGRAVSEPIKVSVPKPIEVEKISIEGEKNILALGENLSLTALVTPDNARDTSIIWKSSNEKVLVVDEEGKVTAVGGGSATITAKSSNEISASVEIQVDGSKRLMSLRVSHPRDDEVNIGNEWSYETDINGEPLGDEYAVSAGDTLNCYAKFIEHDDNPDKGEASTSYTVTEEDIVNGFQIAMDLYVTENGGRNSGQSAHFNITYSFKPQE